MSAEKSLAQRLIGLLDLTSLNDAHDDDMAALCKRALSVTPRPAAVCGWPEFTAACARRLEGSGVALAVVANFPSGQEEPEAVEAEVIAALTAGAGEIDLVWDWRSWQEGRKSEAVALVERIALLTRGQAKLKVILESGAFEGRADLPEAARACLDAGADFLKTSTGKTGKGASHEAARIFLEAIAERGGSAGFKASGGIRTLNDAKGYLDLATEILGEGWADAEHFRIGASSLLDALLAVAGQEG
jgi:deoxyribose-phosphate aldolase